MKTISLLALAAVAIAPVVASAATPLQMETAVWNAYKNKQANAFKAMFTPNYVGVYEDGRTDVAGELQGMKTTNIRSFAISNFNARPIDNGEDVLTTYMVDVKGTRGKADISGHYWSTSVWHRAGNKWQTAYHSEMKAK